MTKDSEEKRCEDVGSKTLLCDFFHGGKNGF